jgi:invasion protein IalB
MVFAKFVKAAAFGAAVALALSLGVTGGIAQSKDKDKGGAKAPATPAAPAGGQQAAAGAQKPADIWYKLCLDVPVADPVKPGEQPKPQKPEEMKKVNVCLTQVDVRDNSTAILIGKIAVRQVQGQDKPQMLAMLPLGSALPPGALVKVDDKEPIKLAYTTCDQAGCYAEASIEPATVDQMKTGKQIAYLGIDVTGRALSIPLPLEGFAKAIDGKPVPVEKYNEDQRKIADVIRQRLAALHKQREDAEKNAQAGGDQPAPAAKPADKKK